MVVVSSGAASVQTNDALADLLRRTAAQDRAAFGALYRATSAKLYGVVAGILGRGALAEETLQEVYVKLWRRAGDFDPARGSPIAWLAAVARNCAIDEARRRAPAATIELTADLANPLDFADPFASRERSDSLRRLLSCLAGLEAEKREMILLAYYRGMSREALGERFKRPASTVKTWLRRGLAQLKECLES